MAVAAGISDLTEQVAAAIASAYERGVNDGKAQMRDSILAAVSSPTADSVEPAEPPQQERPARPHHAPFGPDGMFGAYEGDGRVRAPRGVIDDVLYTALERYPGATTQQLEQVVASLDPRIAKKSIYNRLRYYERLGERFKRTGGRWYLISHSPLIGSPRGEASDHSAAGPQQGPQNGLTPEGGGVGAHPEAGGTC